MMYQRGEVVLIRYPFTDLTSAKARPAVVLSSETYHQQRAEVIVAALTGNLAAATGELDYILQDWSAARLRLPTAFKPVLATIHSSLIVHTIGFLSHRDLQEIEARIRRMPDIP